jgi:hypothetical protein
MWEQRNNVNQNTMHPQSAAAVEEIKAQLRVLYQHGSNSLLPINCHLFSKSAATLQLGEPNLMLQWITSALTAFRRAAVATHNLERTMTAKRALMQRWLALSIPALKEYLPSNHPLINLCACGAQLLHPYLRISSITPGNYHHKKMHIRK